MVRVGGAGPPVSSGFVESEGWSPIRVLARSLEAEQERWFLWVPVLFGTGIALYFALPAEPPLLTALLPAAGVLALRYGILRGALAGLAGVALLSGALGFAAAKVRSEWVRAPVLERQIGPVRVSGFVELVEPRVGPGQRVTMRVTAIDGLAPDARPYRVRIRTGAQNAAIEPGHLVETRATLSPPPGPPLPGGYDFARTAWFQALGGVGFARERAEIAGEAGKEAPAALRLAAAVARVRQAIGERVRAALPGETGAIANALITGERGGISETTNQAFRDAGLFHILSISGLHMVIMAGAVYFSVRLLLAAIPPVALRYPIKKWAAAGAMAGALAYLLISGASFPTVRSYIMISIMFLAVLLDRPALALRNVALAALAILVVWPESLLDAGFQMSFAAVVALVSAYEWLRRRSERDGAWESRGTVRIVMRFFGGIVLSTLVASLAVAPFGIYHFHNTQHFAILANLLAIPICNIVVMPAALAALVAMIAGLEALPLWIMGWGIEAIVSCAEWVARMPGAVGRVPAIPAAAFLLMVAGGLWATLWQTRWRVLGAVPFVAGCLLAPWAARPDVLVGRGATLVAVRGEDGKLSALARKDATFELARWLEHDGDGRPPAEATKAAAFQCDRLGCTARVKGRTVAVAAEAAALRDDCGSAAIVILRFSRPRGCVPDGVTIDARDLEERGAHAIYIGEGYAVRVETVAGARGARPWSGARETGQ